MKNPRFMSLVLLLIIVSVNIGGGYNTCIQVLANYTPQINEGENVPFSIEVKVDNSTVERREDIVLLISIEADEGFNSTVNLDLEIDFVGYNLSINMFPLYPSFPRMQEATIEIPSLAQSGLAKGVLRATSGDYSLEKTVWIYLVGEDELSDEDKKVLEYLKLSISDPNNAPEYHKQIYEAYMRARREAVDGAQEEMTIQEKKAKEAEEKGGSWGGLKVVLRIIIEMIKRLLRIFD